MSGYENIHLTIDDGIARIRLNRPEVLNALSRPLIEEMISAVDRLRDGGDARVLVLSGEGKGFSSGTDLSAGSSPAGGSGFDAGAVLERYYNPLIERLFALPMPVVAAVHGPVVGAGCMLALAADIIVAQRSSYFLQAFINVGLIPDSGSMWLLPRLIGRTRALSVMMMGERIPAAQALEWGMISELVEDGALETRTDEIAEKLAKGPTLSYALIRRGVRAALEQPLSCALQIERDAQRQAGDSTDFREGIAAFREKRRAVFTGR